MRTRSATEHGKDLMSGEAEGNKIIAQRLWTKICEGSNPVSDSGTGGSTPRDAFMNGYDDTDLLTFSGVDHLA
jgi:hypothetical protein